MCLGEVGGWLTDLDYGNVPAWLGLGTLLLALRVFLRDRTTAARSQIDLVAVWMRPEWEPQLPGQRKDRIEDARITQFIRNGSALPVDVVQVAYDVTTEWWVKDQDQTPDQVETWTPTAGTGRVQFYLGPVRIPPMETWENQPQPVNLAHLAPEHADQLSPATGGVDYKIRWVLILDSAGRRWEACPGRKTRRLRWYSFRRRDYPREWQHRITWARRRFPHWVREQVEARRTL
jgi:hypothetical protein